MSTSARVEGPSIQVKVAAIPGRTYQTTVFDAGKAVWTTQVTSISANLVVPVPMAKLPPSGIIKTVELP